MTPTSRNRAAVIALAALIVLTLAPQTFAIFPWESKGTGIFGLKGGALGRAKFVTTDDSTQTKIGASFGLFVDFPIGPVVKTGFSFDLYNIVALGNTNYMIDGSWTLKYDHRWTETGLALKPAAAIGVGLLPKTGYMSDTVYLTLKAWLELHMLLPRNRALLIEFGVFNAPKGGDSSIDVKIGPAVFLRLGYVP